ncbi:MAG: helix-turn-helix domain-containing protein [Eubacteriales bacterium]|nr:helix-turn-helix domain-containing protein [Eubacteriales bacterium]
MGEIQEAVKRLKNGDEKAVESIYLKMCPLIYKLARNTHFMEQDDAVQELSLKLIQLISKLDEERSEGESVVFIWKSLTKHLSKLAYKYGPNSDNKINIDKVQLETSTCNCELDSLIFKVDFSNYLKHVRKTNPKYAEILKLSIFEGISDQEIGRKLNFTRQYVHRIRIMLLKKYIEMERIV